MNNSKTSVQFLGDHPVFIDGFPKECERSVQGSLHFYPRRLTEITEGELSYLKAKRSEIFKFLKVMPSPREKKDAPQSPPAEPVPPKEVAQEQPKEEIHEEAAVYEKKWKKKGKGFEG